MTPTAAADSRLGAAPTPPSLAHVTKHDHSVVMNNSREIQVRVAALKARLREYLRVVRQGQAVVVYDRDTPVARLVPFAGGAEPVACRPPERPLHDVPLPRPLTRAVNSLQALREERQSHR